MCIAVLFWRTHCGIIALYWQAMRVVNGRELVTPDGHCHCALRYKQKTEIKPKLLTVLKIKRFKESIASQISRF